MWNYPTVKQFIYSDKRGAPCLLGKEGIKDVLAPIHVISYDKEQGLIFGGNDNNLICAEIYEYIPEALDLEEYSAKGNLGNAYVVRRCFDKILRAVSSFKALQIFHRDLNPQNILIPSRNPEDIVVIDFNCAVQEQNLCRSVEGIYSCPHNEKSRKIDEFSLGLLLLQMCTGLSPDSIFEDKTIRDRVLEGDIPLSLDISEDLRELIIALLQTDPKQRVDVEGAIKMLGFKPLTLETFSEFG
jgi:serine/threonine protein kinase